MKLKMLDIPKSNMAFGFAVLVWSYSSPTAFKFHPGSVAFVYIKTLCCFFIKFLYLYI